MKPIKIGNKSFEIQKVGGPEIRRVELLKNDFFFIIKIFDGENPTPRVHTGKEKYISKLWAELIRGQK